MQFTEQSETNLLKEYFIKKNGEFIMKKKTAISIGYGMRSLAYSRYAVEHPDEFEIVAVAEPVDNKREYAKELHKLANERVFSDWRQIAELPKMADIAIIGTQDNMHYEPAIAFIEKGYNLLLEKPMAPTPEECKNITKAAEKAGVHVIVCHVLRFTQFWLKIKDIVDNGDIGEIISIIHMENVGNRHQSHSYVRGNWRNSKESSPMILAKSCHDTDIVQWLIGKKCKKVQSFGSISYFNAEHRPKGAPDYCIQGCPHSDKCFYNAIKLYYDDKDNDWFRGVAAKKVAPTDEEVKAAITTGPYGRCVFACDNDVVDHQVVNMEFEDGATVSFTMNAFNEGGRHIRIFGTCGELCGDMEKGTIDVFSFSTRQHIIYNLKQICGDITGGHGGGDSGIVADMLRFVRGEGQSKSICDIRTSYLNHLIAFAAEKSRLTGTVIDMKEYEYML